MITITYHVAPAEKDAEIAWLKEMKIFPSTRLMWNWALNNDRVYFGVIVSPDAALAIKLRHKLDTQNNYKQR